MTKKGHSEICAQKKSKFFVNLPWKIEILLPGSTTPRFHTPDWRCCTPDWRCCL